MQSLSLPLVSYGGAKTTVDEITHVIAAPFQTYSLGNILRLPNAESCLWRVGWIDFHVPRWRQLPHDKRSACIPDDVLAGLVIDAWPPLRLVEDEEVVPGVEMFWTGTHHRSRPGGNVLDGNTPSLETWP